MKLRRILVANRGEIACRVMRTIRALGLESAAVFSEADREAPHVLLADMASEIGPPPAAESYLDVAKVVGAAKRLGCDGVHPGYGFLSENARFAQSCRDAGLVFIGPSPDAIRKMGDKAEARRIARACGVDPVPGSQGAVEPARVGEVASGIGFPLLIKAAMGGGGKGMRLVRGAAELETAVAAARREAKAAFGDESFLIERYVHPARHVEVQVLGDGRGKVVALGERECSLQRRHQKVIEESPSPAVDEAIRARICAAAARLAAEVRYSGAGTVEFLLEEDGRFWFLEMNTRLQVEHGVTELVTGEDLVAWQIRIAEGEALALEGPIQPRGWALEARVYAEDPASGFLPQAGRLRHLALPSGPGIRVDAGVRGGQEVSPWYDPLIAKVMAHGPDRESARRRLAAALRDTAILGPAINVAYLIDILESDAFRSGATFTHTLEGLPPWKPSAPPPEALWLAAAALEHRAGAGDRSADSRSGAGDAGPPSPFTQLGAFRLVE